jgi:hypothetical protein
LAIINDEGEFEKFVWNVAKEYYEVQDSQIQERITESVIALRNSPKPDFAQRF